MLPNGVLWNDQVPKTPRNHYHPTMPLQTHNLIAGRWCPGDTTRPIHHAWTGAKIAESHVATENDMEIATVAAVDAMAETRRRPTHARAAILARASEILTRRKSDLVAAMNAELGRPASLNAGEVDRAAFTLLNASEEAKRLHGEYIPLDLLPMAEQRYSWWKREPVGPVFGITPFNFPVNLMVHKVAPAIASGCSITLKIPPQTPLTPRIVGEVLEEAGVIPGELNLMDCEPSVAEAAVRDERYKLLTFTGSPRAGWHLKSVAGKKRVLLELGNSSGAIVHHGVRDLGWVARRLAFGAFAAAGQVCIHVQRIFVDHRSWRPFLNAFLERAKTYQPLPANNPDAVLGALIDDAAADRVEAWVNDALSQGATALLPFRREGRKVWPCVLTNVTNDMKVCREEVFGPVVTLMPFESLEDAIRDTNATPFGLQAGVFTDSIDAMHQCIDGLEVAAVMVNEYPMFRIDHMPYGGIKDSGLGREGVRFAIEEYTEKKLVVVNQRPWE